MIGIFYKRKMGNNVQQLYLPDDERHDDADAASSLASLVVQVVIDMPL